MTKAIVLRTCSVFLIISAFFFAISFSVDSATAWMIGITSSVTASILMIFAIVVAGKKVHRPTAAHINFRPTGLRGAL